MAKKKTKKKAAKKAPAKNTKKKVAKKPARKAAKKGKKKPLDFIISKSRTKNAAGINVSGDFYGALDAAVREIISEAEARAVSNGRKTLRPHDL
jgi:histone H3/H4